VRQADGGKGIRLSRVLSVQRSQAGQDAQTDSGSGSARALGLLADLGALPRTGGVTRYWVSWWSDQLADGIPWTCWITGERFVHPSQSVCAVIDAESKEAVWQQVGEYFPDNEHRFALKQADDWEPPKDRFP
jgi:hypothetical protein